jgi:hypothetical protein
VNELIRDSQNIPESRITSLESVTSSLMGNRNDMFGVREFIRETKEAFAINVSAIHQLNDRINNLYRYINCKDHFASFPNSLDIPTLDSENFFGPSLNPNFPGLGQVLGGDPSIRRLAGERLPIIGSLSGTGPLGQVLGGDPSIRRLAGEELRALFFE